MRYLLYMILSLYLIGVYIPSEYTGDIVMPVIVFIFMMAHRHYKKKRD